jgi:hypothetical protein
MKTFEVYTKTVVKGAFLTQEIAKQIGTVRAQNIQEAQKEINRLYRDLSGAYAVGHMAK